ncbi:alpha/beta hydrolase-fold protein [Aureivirga marina]|uniref:alpha/beta hydrolase-fold protein n=1 Tax=Aureivirga marina TaxID=1182451 RepID=UPI0018C99061|nr:alpha/beta hydrolase-fold protein [Aureivirga marina]
MKQSLFLIFTFFCILFSSTNVNAQQNDFLVKAGIKETIHSKILKEERTYFIHLPRNYKETKKYPVTYIIDGEVFLPTVANFHEFYSGGFIPEMILIGISNQKNRTRDLTTSKIKKKYGMPFKEKNGEAENFLKFISEELIPQIELKYSVTNYRTLIGHSYGGLFTIYTLINKPELFANYLAIDPSLDWDDQKLIKDFKKQMLNSKYKNKSLFITLSGQLHMQNPNITIENVMQDDSDFTIFARSNLKLKDILQSKINQHIAFNWKFYPNDLHGTVAYPSISDGMISMFRWFQMEKTDRFNSFDTPKEELLSIIKYREQKLLNHFGYKVAPYPEDLMNMSGYMYMDMNQPEKAKMFLELAIDFYPNSANVYDSMSDFYLRNENKKKALEFAQKAYEIEKSDYLKKKIKKLSK